MRCVLFSLIAVMLACPGKAADPVLAPNGTLRAAYIGPNVAQARLDGNRHNSGVIADIARELGRRADAPVSITPLPTAAAVLDAVRSGQVDIGFVAPNPERTGIVLYSRRYMLVQQSALVRADSALRSVKELDRPGQVIGVNTDDSVGVWLKQRLTAAKVREMPDYTLRDAVQWLRQDLYHEMDCFEDLHGPTLSLSEGVDHGKDACSADFQGRRALRTCGTRCP